MTAELSSIAQGRILAALGRDPRLGHGDALACLEIIHRSLSCRDRQDLSALLGAVGTLVGVDQWGSRLPSSSPELRPDRRIQVILDLVLPHLDRALAGLAPGSAPPAPALSARERQVLRWVSAGKSSWEIGKIMRITERTVNYHIRNILRKLDAVNRPQAVAMALKLGLLAPA